MVCDLEATTFEDQAVWRIGHAPTPWRFADWAHADQHGRFDGRWDDPEGSYRVLTEEWRSHLGAAASNGHDWEDLMTTVGDL
jgi:hypothetical protein